MRDYIYIQMIITNIYKERREIIREREREESREDFDDIMKK